MISFIGLGLWNENSMSLETLEEMKKCDKLFAEFYTSKLMGTSLKELEKKVGKKIEVLSREEVESGESKEKIETGNKILEQGKSAKIGFLVAGDAMTATTHIDLLLEAKKLGIKTKVVHGTSIYSAAPGIAGLQIYKFGKSTSIPFEQKGFRIESPYKVIQENKKIGAHTLIFLDIKGEKCLSANEAINILLSIEKEKGEKVFTEETEVVIVARAGSPKPLVKYGKVKDLLKKDFGKPLHVLIVPGKLHFKEEEALELWK